MAVGVLSKLVCVLCFILLPAVWANSCSGYEDSSGYRHQDQQCGSQYCCGDCKKKYCCSNKMHRLSKKKEQSCYGSSTDLGKRSHLPILLGSIIGSILLIAMLSMCLIICCVAPGCLFFKKYRKGGNQSAQIVTYATTPDALPTGYQPAYPGYQPVPALPGYESQHTPGAPPPYSETIDPAHSPAAFPAGMPMPPFPGPPYAPPPHSAPMPYNPTYVPNL